MNEAERSKSKVSLVLSYILYSFTWESLILGQGIFLR